MHAEQKDYCIYETVLCINLITTQKISRTENITHKKRGIIIEYHQTKIADRYTKAKNQWRHQAIKKKKIK